MKSVRIAAALAIVLAIAAFVVADDKPWFDMKNCAMCSTLSSKPGLLESMTWEHFPISNGAVQVGYCPEEHKAAFGQAMGEMQKVAEKLQAGETVNLDGYCMAYGDLMQSGANFEYIEAAHSNVTIITSNDPKVIKKIHDFTQRTKDELAKMVAAEAPAKSN